MSPLEISLLGTFQITRGTTPITDFASNKVRALLAYLALESDRPHLRDALAGLLWPDSTQEMALKSLRNALANLRGAIGDRQASPPYLIITRETIQFNPNSSYHLDAADLIKPDSGQQTELRRRIAAVEGYHGPFLEGFSIPDSAAFEEWTSLWRERLERKTLEELRWLAEYYENRGEISQALASARRQAALDPWMEEGHYQVMRLLALSGQREQALRQYHTLREILHKNLEAEPSLGATRLYNEILTGRFPSPPPKNHPPHNLPVQVTSFIGREKEIEQLKEVILSDQTRLVTVTGAGGIGKSRLALRAAEELLDAFPDGVWLIELAALADPELVPNAVGTVLKQRGSPDKPILEVLGDYLRLKRVLILLDNCEHLVDAVARLVDRIIHTSTLAVIVATSREILGVNGEILFLCPSLTLPETQLQQNCTENEQLKALVSCEAVRLFAERSAQTAPSFAILQKNAPSVAQVCRRLDGIPLAIELAAARTRVLSVEQIAERLDHAFVLLTGGSRTALPRQQTLKATIDWSYNLLTPAERALLLRLAIFSGGWTLEAAETVCEGDDAGPVNILPEEILDLLGRLCDKSLIMVEAGQEGESRYRMLETIRQYAREKLYAEGDESAVRNRHAAYYVHLALQAEPGLRGANQLAWLNRIEQEIDNLRLALAESLNTNIYVELQLASALKWFWHNRGRWEEGLTWINTGLQGIGAKDDGLTGNDPNSVADINSTIHAKALAAAGYLYGKIPANLDNANGLNKASNLLKESLSIYRRLRHQGRQGMATVLLQLACYSKESDRPAQMLSWANQSLDLFQEEGDDFGISECLSFLGSMERNSSLAEEQLLDALKLKNKIGDIDGTAHLFEYLGELEIFKGDYDVAAKYFLESLDHFGKIDNQSYKTRCLGKLSWVDWISGEADQAFDKIQRALASNLEHETHQRSDFLLQRAKIHLSLGQLLEANKDGWAALEAVKELPCSLSHVSALIFQARLAWIEGDTATAIKDLGKAMALTREIRGPNIRAQALYYIGRINTPQGSLSSAKQYLTVSLKEHANLWLWIDRCKIAYPLEGMAGLAVLEGDPERAAKLFGAANRRFSRLSKTFSPFELEIRESEIVQAWRALGESVFAQLWHEGWDLTFDQAAAYALDKK